MTKSNVTRAVLAVVTAVLLASCVETGVQKTLPAGTVLRVEMLETVSSGTNKPGDRVVAQVVDPIEIDGVVVVPAGSEVTGTVVDVVPRKKIGGRPKLGLEFTNLDPPSGSALAIRA